VGLQKNMGQQHVRAQGRGMGFDHLLQELASPGKLFPRQVGTRPEEPAFDWLAAVAV
jgi:hypothetical protein